MIYLEFRKDTELDLTKIKLIYQRELSKVLPKQVPVPLLNQKTNKTELIRIDTFELIKNIEIFRNFQYDKIIIGLKEHKYYKDTSLTYDSIAKMIEFGNIYFPGLGVFSKVKNQLS